MIKRNMEVTYLLGYLGCRNDNIGLFTLEIAPTRVFSFSLDRREIDDLVFVEFRKPCLAVIQLENSKACVLQSLSKRIVKVLLSDRKSATVLGQ